MPWPPEDPDMWAVEARFKGGKKVHETAQDVVNDARKSVESKREEKKVPVIEIFGPTVQGEGMMIGVRTTFIRFGLCDYKCTMCDSMHAVDPVQVKANAKWMTSEEILEELQPHQKGCDWVTLSGGNPCIHDLNKLVLGIKSLGIKIAVETQGTFCPSWLHMCDVVTVSPKSPGMGEQFEEEKFYNFVQQFQFHPGFNVKVVVFSMADIDWARTINEVMVDAGLGEKMYLSLGNPYPPGKDDALDGLGDMDDSIHANDRLKLTLLQNYMQLTEDLLQIPDMRNVKFLPQMHVLTWANKQKV